VDNRECKTPCARRQAESSLDQLIEDLFAKLSPEDERRFFDFCLANLSPHQQHRLVTMTLEEANAHLAALTDDDKRDVMAILTAAVRVEGRA
jgi:hypothetical protein